MPRIRSSPHDRDPIGESNWSAQSGSGRNRETSALGKRRCFEPESESSEVELTIPARGAVPHGLVERRSLIPTPSSAIRIHPPSRSWPTSTRPSSASASIELSTRSATADGRSYPMSRSDSIRRRAEGMSSSWRHADGRLRIYASMRAALSHCDPAGTLSTADRSGRQISFPRSITAALNGRVRSRWSCEAIQVEPKLPATGLVSARHACSDTSGCRVQRYCIAPVAKAETALATESPTPGMARSSRSSSGTWPSNSSISARAALTTAPAAWALNPAASSASRGKLSARSSSAGEGATA